MGRNWRKPDFEVEVMGAGNGVARNKFWLGVDVHGVEVRAGVASSSGSAFSDIFAWTF